MQIALTITGGDEHGSVFGCPHRQCFHNGHCLPFGRDLRRKQLFRIEGQNGTGFSPRSDGACITLEATLAASVFSLIQTRDVNTR
jgi:hypothetical protein